MSIFDHMPDFQSFRNSQNSGAPPAAPTSIYNSRVPFSSPVTFDPSTNTDPSANIPAESSGSSGGSSGFFSHLWNGMMNGGKSALDFVGHKFDQFENFTGLNHIGGAAKGLINGAMTAPTGNNLVSAYGNGISGALHGAAQGWNNPDQAAQQGQQMMDKAFPNPFLHGLNSFGYSAGTDPLSYIPVGPAASLIGKAAKAGSDAVGATPYIRGAVDAVKASKQVEAVSAALGKAFVPFYGASDGVGQGIKDLEGAHAADQMAIQKHMTELAQQHGLTPDQVRQLPEVFQAKGSADPALHQAYMDLNQSLYNGVPLHDGFKIGTNAETSTMFNGKPILEPGKLLEGYYPHRYAKDMNPTLQEKMQKLIPSSNEKGFSTSGPFGQERQFKTIGEAEANGFNPERNAYAAIAQRLAESAKAMRTSQFLQGLMDRGVISKEALPGMKASDIKPVGSYFTVHEKAPAGVSPLSQAVNESGSAFKPLTRLSDAGFSLPKELMKSAPKYRSNPLAFSNDLDKAAYIIGNTTSRSARDADFVKALVSHTGLTDPELRAYGQYMRSAVKSAANGVADGEAIQVPRTLSNLPEHGGNGFPHAGAAAAEDPNNFMNLAKSLEESNPADKLVKVNPFYIRPHDEAAIKEYLDPARPTGIFGAANKLNNLYNKGFLLNPLPHIHNVTTNGIGLGEANPTYIKEALSSINKGASDPWYEQAVRAGAVSGLRGGNLMQNVNAAMAPAKGLAGKMMDKFNYARHDFLWNTDSAIRTALFRQAKESGMSDAEAAGHTNKFMVDYNNITPFERKYIKPVVPFYAWKKGNIPLQISQTFAQTPKYASYQHLKDTVSQEASGQPTDQKGRIMTGETLSDGSQVALDPYNPMDEPGKIMEKGPLPWLLGSINPVWREGIAQGSSALGAYNPAFGLQNKFPIYNAGAPAEYNVRKGIAHAISGLNPLGSSAILGEVGNPSNLINGLMGLPTKDKPGETSSELVTKLLGGFTGRDNPGKDAVNQQYQQKDNLIGQIKYLKDTGQSVPKALQKQAYKRIRIPVAQ